MLFPVVVLLEECCCHFRGTETWWEVFSEERKHVSSRHFLNPFTVADRRCIFSWTYQIAEFVTRKNFGSFHTPTHLGIPNGIIPFNCLSSPRLVKSWEHSFVKLVRVEPPVPTPDVLWTWLLCWAIGQAQRLDQRLSSDDQLCAWLCLRLSHVVAIDIWCSNWEVRFDVVWHLNSTLGKLRI